MLNDACLHAAMSPLPSRDLAEIQITILGCSCNFMLIRWVESGRRPYGEQKWRRAVARRDSRCAYSGRVIEPGDAVLKKCVSMLACTTPGLQEVF